MRMTRRCRYPKILAGALLAVGLSISTETARAQRTLFDVRFDPPSVSALESAGQTRVSVTVELINSAPVANPDSFQIDFPAPATPCIVNVPAPGVLANDSDPDGDPITAIGINLPAGLVLNGDGSFVFTSPFGCSGSQSFSYLTSDTITSSTPTTVDLVLNLAPVANPGGPYTPGTNIPFNLDGTASSDPDGSITSWSWNFGDGNLGTGPSPSHTYTMAGLYDVSLTVTDNLGAQSTAMTTANVIDPVPRSQSQVGSSAADRFRADPGTQGKPATRVRSEVRVSTLPSGSWQSRSVGGAASHPHAADLNRRMPPATVSTANIGGGAFPTFTATYSVVSGTATGGVDFVEIPTGTLQWTLQNTFPLQLSFQVAILHDDQVEDDETVALTLSSPDTEVAVSTPSGLLTITDDDALGTVQFRQDRLRENEGSGTTTILVDLTGSQSSPSSVDYTITAGSATEGVDFAASSGTLTWQLGVQGTQTFTVEILEDNLQEDDETVILTLSNPVGITLGAPSTATLVIADNDQPARVQIERGDAQNGKVGSDLDEPLVVRVTSADGEPVAGATVSWELVEGAGEFLDGAETTTDSEGLSSNRLRLGTELGDVQVRASVAAVQESAMFSLVAELRLSELGLGANEQPVAEVLDDICNGDNLGGMTSTCDDLAELTDDDQRVAVGELSPKKVVAQGDSAIAMMRTQYDLIQDRLRGLRRNRERSLSNLALQLHDIRVPITALADSLSSESASESKLRSGPEIEHRGGGASADEPGSADDESWLGKRLGLFLSGVIAVGDRPTIEEEIGFDLDTTGLTFGVDYKFSDKLVWGGALGYMSTDGDLAGSGGTLDSEGLSLSTYLLLLPAEQGFVELVASYGDIDFESERTIDFPGNRQTARADPQGDQRFLGIGGGYDLLSGGSTFSFVTRASYLDVEIDPYREDSAPGMQLSVGGQTIESLLASGGIEYFYTASTSWGIVTPGLRLLYNHEFKDDLRFITASFVDDPQSLSFAIPTAEPDRDYLRGGFSLTATFPRGISAYATYDNDFSRDDVSLYVITAGFRLELK